MAIEGHENDFPTLFIMGDVSEGISPRLQLINAGMILEKMQLRQEAEHLCVGGFPPKCKKVRLAARKPAKTNQSTARNAPQHAVWQFHAGLPAIVHETPEPNSESAARKTAATQEGQPPLPAEANDQASIPRSYVLAYMTSANIGIVQHWLEIGMQHTPNEMPLMVTCLSGQGPINAFGVPQQA